MSRESWGSPTCPKQLLQMPLNVVDTEERQMVGISFSSPKPFSSSLRLHGSGSGFRRWWSWEERSAS